MELENRAVQIDIPENYSPTIVVVKGVHYKKHGHYSTKNGMADGVVVHYTVSGRNATSARGVVAFLAKEGLGCPVMDEDGVIYIPEDFDILRDVVYHAGKSTWKGRSGMSAYCIGMEMCCWGLGANGGKAGPIREIKRQTENQKPGKYQAYTPAQEQALINFILWVKKKNPDFNLDMVVGHDEIAPTRKQDPGGSLSMTMPALRAHLKGASPSPVPKAPAETSPKSDYQAPAYGDTKEFVKAFQRKNHLDDDGDPGKDTWAALNK